MTRHREIKRYLTTGQVSRMLGVAPRTVTGWCGNCGLKHIRIPGRSGNGHGGGDRRILPADLVAWLREHQWDPPPDLLQLIAPPLILVGVEPLLAGRLSAQLPGCETVVCTGAFDLGRSLPMVSRGRVVLSAGIGLPECRALLHSLAELNGCRPWVVLLASEDEADERQWLSCGADAVLRQPVNPVHLASLLLEVES